MPTLLTIAIESAVAGGSLALLDDGNIIDSWCSDDNISRSENLLPLIEEMLQRSGASVSDLENVAVSIGPGSYTGIRIGLATAIGLAQSLAINCIGVSLLDALYMKHDQGSSQVVVLPIGRDGFCWRYFGGLGDAESHEGAAIGKVDSLRAYLKSLSNPIICAHSNAIPIVSYLQLEIVDAGRDLATAIGLASRVRDDGLIPFYAR